MITYTLFVFGSTIANLDITQNQFLKIIINIIF